MINKVFPFDVRGFVKVDDVDAYLAEVQFRGHGVDHQVVFSDYYDGVRDDLSLSSFLLSVALFRDDIKQLQEDSSLQEVMELYFRVPIRIDAVCQLKWPGKRGTPYKLTEHRLVSSQPFARLRKAAGLVSFREALDRDRAWRARA